MYVFDQIVCFSLEFVVYIKIFLIVTLYFLFARYIVALIRLNRFDFKEPIRVQIHLIKFD